MGEKLNAKDAAIGGAEMNHRRKTMALVRGVG